MSDATYTGLGPSTSSSSPGSLDAISTSPFSLSTLGPTAAAGGGLAALLLSGGGPQIPWQVGQVGANATGLEGEASTLWGTGNQLIAGGESSLGPAMAGVLTPEQQATLTTEQQSAENVADQTFAAMGRNPNQDTSFISTQTDINTKLMAAANTFVNTNIQNAFSEISAGGTLTSQGNTDMNAANQALLESARLTMQADQNYSNSLTSAFSAIGTIFGGVAGFAAGGPAGAVAGANIGKAL
jgi:hypothetical protein